MTYAAQADMVERFGEAEIAQRTNRVDGSTIDQAVLARALGDADAEINSYLAARYQLPLAATPTVLVRLACDMARYQLFSDGAPDVIRQRYQDAVSLLKRMASGEVQLDGVAALQPAHGGQAVVSRSPARVFSDAVLKHY